MRKVINRSKNVFGETFFKRGFKRIVLNPQNLKAFKSMINIQKLQN